MQPNYKIIKAIARGREIDSQELLALIIEYRAKTRSI